MAVKLEKLEQITLLLENRPGILADLCARLSAKQVNIRAITTHESTDASRVRMVVSDTELAKRVVEEAGVPFSSTYCLAVELANLPGGIAAVARTLALGGINIDYLYATSDSGRTTGLCVFGVSDIDRAMALDWR
jgi:hypothetical protein